MSLTEPRHSHFFGCISIVPDELGLDDRFVDGADLSLTPLDEIDRELRLSARSTLTVFLPDRSNPAAFQDWPLAAELLDWRKRGHGTQLALAPALLTTLSPAEKLGTIGVMPPTKRRLSNCSVSSAVFAFPCSRRMCRMAVTSTSILRMEPRRRSYWTKGLALGHRPGRLLFAMTSRPMPLPR